MGRSFKVDNVCCELTYVDNDDEWCLSANCLLCGEMSDSVPLNQLRPDRPMRLRCRCSTWAISAAGIEDLYQEAERLAALFDEWPPEPPHS